MKKFIIDIYNNVLLHGFGWYETGVIIYAKNLSNCIKKVNEIYNFESTLQIYNATDDKLYRTSESRKTIVLSI